MLPVTSCIKWAVVAVVGSAGRLLTFPWEEQYYHPGWASTIWPLSSPARPWHFFKGRGKELILLGLYSARSSPCQMGWGFSIPAPCFPLFAELLCQTPVCPWEGWVERRQFMDYSLCLSHGQLSPCWEFKSQEIGSHFTVFSLLIVIISISEKREKECAKTIWKKCTH